MCHHQEVTWKESYNITKGIAILGSKEVAIVGKHIFEKPSPLILLRKAAKKNNKNMETIV